MSPRRRREQAPPCGNGKMKAKCFSQCSHKQKGSLREGAFRCPRLTKPNICRGGGSPPACREFYLADRRRTPEPALCKGRCRAPRGGGVVPDRNSLLFLFCNLQTFTIPQALRASSLYTREPLGLCEHCKKFCCFRRAGAYGMPPYEVRFFAGMAGDHWSPLRYLYFYSVGEDSISSRPDVKLLFP